MKTKLAIAVMCIMTYSAQADYAADQQYLSGQSFVLRWYDSSDLKSKAGNRKAIQFTVDKIVIETIDKFIGICGDTRAEVLENAITTWACDSIEALPAIKLKMGITQ